MPVSIGSASVTRSGFLCPTTRSSNTTGQSKTVSSGGVAPTAAKVEFLTHVHHSGGRFGRYKSLWRPSSSTARSEVQRSIAKTSRRPLLSVSLHSTWPYALTLFGPGSSPRKSAGEAACSDVLRSHLVPAPLQTFLRGETIRLAIVVRRSHDPSLVEPASPLNRRQRASL